MEAYGITCGIKKDVDDFITQLQGKYLPFNYREKKEDPFKIAQLQMLVAPIQLWKFAFPEAQKDVAMTTIFGTEPNNTGKNKKLFKWIFRFMEVLRKMMGLDKLVKYKTDNQLPISRQNMYCLCIGTKKDYIMPNGVEGI